MKRSIFPVLIVLLLCVVAVGFYRGWFTLSSSPEPGSNKVDVKLGMDRDKMKEDAATVENKTKELVGKVTEEVTGPAPAATGKAK